MISSDDKAIAIQLAMGIDLGVINLEVALKEIRSDIITWTPILEFMESCCDLTRQAIDKLYFESLLLKS